MKNGEEGGKKKKENEIGFNGQALDLGETTKKRKKERERKRETERDIEREQRYREGVRELEEKATKKKRGGRERERGEEKIILLLEEFSILGVEGKEREKERE